MRKVEVVPHNPKWREVFEVESKLFTDAPGENVISIHHIGSTAIPNIYVKPIIDLLVEVKDTVKVDGQKNNQWRRTGNRRTRMQNKQDKGIEEIAHKIYINRMQFNKPGDDQTDWETAKKIGNNPLKKLLFVGNQSLIKLRKPASKSFKSVTWDFPRWFLYSLPQLEWMKLIAVPLVLAAAGSIISSQIQREANQISALNKYFDQLERLTFEQKLLDKNPNSGAIVLAQGRTISSLRELDIERKRQLLSFLQASGLLRIISLESTIFADTDLSSTDLRNANLSKSNFKKANLQEANLYRASLSKATLDEANLQGADLFHANLSGATLNRASLQGAFLSSADLSYAKLNGANLQGADLGFASSIREDIFPTYLKKAELKEADLKGARLYLVNLSGANLSGANLKEVDLESANLSGTNLKGANLEGANLKKVDLTKALNVTQEQFSKALLCETKTTFPLDQPSTIFPPPDLVSNRDCNEIEELSWKWDLPRTRHKDYSGASSSEMNF
jgi:uncharacterized protein YjbI with pentapeptide repeats